MICKKFDYLSVVDLEDHKKNTVFEVTPMDMTFIWNTGKTMDIVVDKVSYQLVQNDIVFLNSFNKVNDISFEKARMIRFNEAFFCIMNGTEIGQQSQLLTDLGRVPIASITESELRSFEISWEMFCLEPAAKDHMQKYIFQTGLQRLLILFSRNFRNPLGGKCRGDYRAELVRKFNFLVEGHFAKHHDVAYYASRLNKSPKTLSNVFSTLSDKSPMSIIHDRIMLHACKQIRYTALSIKEIAYELGYEDIQTFSRFFKNKQGMSPTNYREFAKGF